jgi:lipooligosaccharide transport system permease protein
MILRRTRQITLLDDGLDQYRACPKAVDPEAFPAGIDYWLFSDALAWRAPWCGRFQCRDLGPLFTRSPLAGPAVLLEGTLIIDSPGIERLQDAPQEWPHPWCVVPHPVAAKRSWRLPLKTEDRLGQGPPEALLPSWRGTVVVGESLMLLAALRLRAPGTRLVLALPRSVDPHLQRCVAAAAIQGVLDEVTFPTMDGFIWEKHFFAIQNSPITPRQIANGVLLIAIFRGFITTVMYLAVLLLFGAIPWSSVLALVLTSMFAAVAFSAVMMGITAALKDDDGFFAIIGRFVIAPMFLFSGTFYPLELMPIYLQWIGWISPLWHATELGRLLSYGDPLGPGMFAIHLGYFMVMFIAGMWFSYHQFVKRLSE